MEKVKHGVCAVARVVDGLSARDLYQCIQVGLVFVRT
jgi:hypothetical protein